jgi:hypothetical protein
MPGDGLRMPRDGNGDRMTFLLALFLMVLPSAASAYEMPAWDPRALAKENTLDFLTVGPEEGEHWSRVWVVAVDDHLYLRLGRRAASRFEKNTQAPWVKVRIAGREFDRVRAQPAPDMADRVAAAMAEKYWTDILVRYSSHPLIVRLSVTPP